MPRNKKGERFVLARWQLERAFVEPFPKFETCSRLLFLFVTVSDKLSRKNILYSENYLGRFRDNPEFQKDPLFEQRVLQLGDALRRAKDRLVNREANKKTRKEKEQEKEAKKAERKAKGQPQAPPTSPQDPADIWASMLPQEKKP